MIYDKDVKKIITAMKEVFPTAEMVQEGFNEVNGKIKTLTADMETGFKKVNEKLDGEVKSLRERVKVVEEALAIE